MAKKYFFASLGSFGFLSSYQKYITATYISGFCFSFLIISTSNVKGQGDRKCNYTDILTTTI